MSSKKNIFFKGWQGVKKGWAIEWGLLSLGLTALAAHHRGWVESIYSRTLYPIISFILSYTFSWIPFSVTELAIFTIIIAFLASIAWLLARKLSIVKWLFYVSSVVGFLIGWFYFAWGFNYFRQPLYTSVGISLERPDSVLFRQTIDFLIRQTNQSYLPISSLDKKQINREIENGFNRLATKLDISWPKGYRRPKTFLVNYWLNKTLTSGFFSPFFHEIHLNADLLPFEYSFILAHEKAHQMGRAIEAEASFLAFLVCTAGQDKILRYSGYFNTLRPFLARAQVRFRDYQSIRQNLRVEVWNDIQTSRKHWGQYKGRVSRFSYRAYDRYLRANKIAEGIKNYTGVVDYVVGWYGNAMKPSGRDNGGK